MNDRSPAARGRRARAIAFALLALLSAGLAAAVADGYGSKVARSYGPMRQVVVAASALPSGKVIGPGTLAERLQTRRIPARFVPPGTLAHPGEALGLQPETEISAGSYLQGSQLGPPRRRKRASPGLAQGRRPLEIAVTGAGALLAAGTPGSGARVDVVVTTEPRGAGPGRTYIAATRVPLLSLEPGAGIGSTSAAALGVTRGQALELIEAENFARQVRLLPVASR